MAPQKHCQRRQGQAPSLRARRPNLRTLRPPHVFSTTLAPSHGATAPHAAHSARATALRAQLPKRARPCNINTAEPEFGAWNWVVPNELIDMAVPFKRDVYRDVMKSFGTLFDS